MQREDIISISEKKIQNKNINEIQNILESDYEVSYGAYEPVELKKAIHKKTPFYIKNNFIVGYENGCFYNDCNESIKIEKMVKAVIVEDVKEYVAPVQQTEEYQEPVSADMFAIIERNDWEDISDFENIISPLMVNKCYLPSHSVIFCFRNQTEEEKKEKIVSYLQGVKISILQKDNYIDNCFHEIGHVFWRDSLLPEERKAFANYFKILKPSALYQYDWERSNAEEVFCTLYKWYLKSILLNPSFRNILEFEEPKGFDMLLSCIARIKADKLISDQWLLAKNDVMKYFNPPLDHMGRRVMRKGLDQAIADVKVPREVIAENIVSYENGLTKINLEKAVVLSKNNKLVFDKPMQKAENNKPVIFMDMDRVVADFDKGFEQQFGVNPTTIDAFTTKQYYIQNPHFFRELPVLSDGMELFNSLKDKYKIVFLTTPSEGMTYCKIDKIDWIHENFGVYDVLFSDNKSEYVIDNRSILIDDDYYNKNLSAWNEAGGTGIKFVPGKLDKILSQVESIMNPVEEIKKVKAQIKDMSVNTNPSLAQKESGLYKKGTVNYKGLVIKIENPKGSIRWGIGENGKKWVSKMTANYGYITGTEGHDCDPVDVFVGDKIGASRCFVVNQTNNGVFDEHKVILCVDTVKDAEELYLSNYAKGWSNYTDIVQTNTKKLREWLNSGNTHYPFAN